MRYLDLAVILAYLIGITWFGARFRTGQKNLRDYFLGGRTAPWWAISLSIVSAETSTLTVIGTPALAFAGNLGFLQMVFGYLLARIVISVLFLPHYFRGEMFTAYELMRRRFGERIRKLTASIFLVTRALAEGVRVFAISLVISIVLGTGEIASIVLIVLPDPVLHIRRRHDGRHLDRRRADEPLRGRARSSASSSSSDRFPAAGRTWWRWPAPPANSRSSIFTFRSDHGVLLPDLHLLGRNRSAAAS